MDEIEATKAIGACHRRDFVYKDKELMFLVITVSNCIQEANRVQILQFS
jgi:hypothetical protein